MVNYVLAMILAGLAISLVSAADSASCPRGLVSLNVTSAADVETLTDALNCTGPGDFNVTWYSSLTIRRTIEVSNLKNVTVTGSGFPTIRGAPDYNAADATMDAGTGVGILSVSNGSNLRLRHLVLAEGTSQNGGAIDLGFASSLFVFDCTFANNNASYGGAIFASASAIYLDGNTMFEDNSALRGGGGGV